MLETKADKAVMQKLYQESAKKLYFIARQIVQNEAEAEEAVSTCFQKLADNFAEYRSQNYEDLKRLCCIIVKNTANDIAKLHQEKEQVLNVGSSKTENAAVRSQEAHESLKKESILTQALSELNEEDRHVLYMQYGMDLDLKEIGRLMNMTSAEAQKKILNCCNNLITVLEAKTV